jgi:hypothetical protein
MSLGSPAGFWRRRYKLRLLYKRVTRASRLRDLLASLNYAVEELEASMDAMENGEWTRRVAVISRQAKRLKRLREGWSRRSPST